MGDLMTDSTHHQLSNGLIYKQIPKVIQDIGAIAKTRKNPVTNYFYRGVDDVLNALNPVLGKYELSIIPDVHLLRFEEKQTKSGSVMFHVVLQVTYFVFASDGSYIKSTVLGEAANTSDKGINVAMTSAFKNFCFQAFCISTEEIQDSETQTPEFKETNQGSVKEAIKKMVTATTKTPPGRVTGGNSNVFGVMP